MGIRSIPHPLNSAGGANNIIANYCYSDILKQMHKLKQLPIYKYQYIYITIKL